MERLEPELEQLLEKARASEDPTSQDRDRNRDALARRLGSAALVGLAAMTTSDVAGGVAGATKAGASTALLLAVKVGAPLVLIGVVGTVALPRIFAHRSKIAASVATAPVVPEVPPSDEQTSPTPEPPAPASVAKPVGGAPGAAAPPSAARTPALSEEVALLQRAERALRDGKPEQALSVLSEHARQFPKGELRAERTAARIAALCALNRKAEARRDAAAFLKQWPGSPLAAQVRASCAAPDDKVTMP